MQDHLGYQEIMSCFEKFKPDTPNRILVPLRLEFFSKFSTNTPFYMGVLPGEILAGFSNEMDDNEDLINSWTKHYKRKIVKECVLIPSSSSCNKELTSVAPAALSLGLL